MSCNRTREITVYDQIDFLNVQKSYDKLTVIDTVCINGRKRAKLEIKNNQLTYSISSSDAYGTELSELLKKHNINLKRRGFTDIAPPEGFENYCYENLMLEEIINKFGNKFLDSITSVAEKNYVLKNPNEPYIKDGRDLRNIYIQ